MLNAGYLKQEFVQALEKSWSADAIWPGCKDGYAEGVSHPSYGQCLVGTLATWAAHGGPQEGFRIVPGVLMGDNIPDGGVWHFQLQYQEGLEEPVPVDVTWDQVENGVFISAMEAGGAELYREIVQGSFPFDESLIPRLKVIIENIRAQGIHYEPSAKSVAHRAYEHLFDMP